MQKSLKATPSTTTFIVDDGTSETVAKPKVEAMRKSTQSLKSSRNACTKKQGGRKAVQQGGLGMGKRSEANIYGRRQTGVNRELATVGKSWGRPESAMKVEKEENKTSVRRIPSTKVRGTEERGRPSPHRVIYVNKGKRKSDTVSIAIHMPRDKPAILGARTKAPVQRKKKVVNNPPEVAKPSGILETASSFRLNKMYATNWEVNSDVSSSTFVVEPAKPKELNQRKRGKNTSGEDTPDREEEEKKEGTLPERENPIRKKLKRRKPRKNYVCFKIYKRCMPKNLCRRWRQPNSSEESTEEERTILSARRRRRLSSEVGKRMSEPWMKKGFVWRSQHCQRDGGKSVLSINSSLGHMNCDDVEDFSCWERVPTGVATSAWEGFLYKLKKSWSVLSMAAFRKNRLSDTPGEILQILKDGNGFHQRRSPRDHGVPDSPREDLAPSSPFDVEPSIFQKNIDIRNWVDALRFYATRPEEERSTVSTTEEMSKSYRIEFAWRKIDISREGNAVSKLLAFLLGLLAVGYLIPKLNT